MRRIIFSIVVGLLSQSSIADPLSDLSNAIPSNMPSGGVSSDASSSIVVPPIQGYKSGLSSSSSSDSVVNTSPISVEQSIPTPMRSRPPVLPNEFQNSVRIRTGMSLKQYGYDAFSVPNTYNLINNVPIDNNYTLGPGDQIYIQAWGALTMSYTVNVGSDGTIYIPKVGAFNVAGVKAESLEGYLKNKIGKVYKKFQLSATVSKIRSIQVNVTGYAQVPGTYTVSSLTNLSNAIFAAGGPASNGSLRNIELRRNGGIVKKFDMYQVLLKGNNVSDVRLLPGDIIYFTPKSNEVAVYDGVKFPAIYEAKQGETVEDLLSYAGGTSFDNSKNKVVIEQFSNNKVVVNDYDYSQGLQQVLGDGDIVHFSRLNKEYDQTIVLMGNVANPTRLAFRPGMTVKDVLPNKDALLTRSFWDSYSYNTYGKDNVLTQSGLEKTTNRFGNDSPSYNYSAGLNNTVNATTNQSDQSGDILRDPQLNYNGKDSVNTATAQQIFSNSDNLLVAGPVSIPEADINWHYATIIRIDQKNYSTHLIPFDLAKAISGDSVNNIPLQAGDVIDILSSKDVRNPIEYHPTFVFVDGEVNKPGVYELKTGESITSLINRAGGTTQKAYLFGMEIDRLSVKKKQKVVLNQMLDQAQQSLIAQSSAAGLNVINAGQAQIQAQVLQSQQALIDKMRQIQPVGRVVLRIKSNNVAVSDLPNFEMENGDTVYIPPRPNTVDVVGQVYNPATFDYEAGLSVQNYIDQAGTENDYADVSNEYVLQANGILYNRKQAGWFGGFASRNLNPGDTVIVPQKIQFGGFVQNLMNWTQIIANSAQAVVLFTR